MKKIENLGEFLEMEIDYDIDYMFTSSDDYVISFNGINYFLEENILKNSYESIEISSDTSSYIKDKCLEDLPF